MLETPHRGAVEPKLKYSINLIDNIDKFFKYAPAEAKIRALSSIFSGKLEFDGENFRTDNLNSVFDLIYQQTNELRGKNKKARKVCQLSPLRYPEPGSNRHGSPHWCLRPARLPIPPSGPFICAPVRAALQRLRTFESANVQTFI